MYNIKWTEAKLQEESLKYNNRTEFCKKSKWAAHVASKMGIYEQICAHMSKAGSSKAEKEIFNIIKVKFITAKKIRHNKIKIENKPYIQGFEIDIFIPELNKGIEFDGKFYHSYEYMRKDHKRKAWSDDDIRNYHQIKDDYFLNKGIQILHIKEEDWIKDKKECIQRCFEFLKC